MDRPPGSWSIVEVLPKNLAKQHPEEGISEVLPKAFQKPSTNHLATGDADLQEPQHATEKTNAPIACHVEQSNRHTRFTTPEVAPKAQRQRRHVHTDIYYVTPKVVCSAYAGERQTKAKQDEDDLEVVLLMDKHTEPISTHDQRGELKIKNAWTSSGTGTDIPTIDAFDTQWNRQIETEQRQCNGLQQHHCQVEPFVHIDSSENDMDIPTIDAYDANIHLKMNLPAETKQPPPAETKQSPPAETKQPPPAETKQPPPAETKQPPPAETKQTPPVETKQPPPAETKQPPPVETKQPSRSRETSEIDQGLYVVQPDARGAREPEYRKRSPPVPEDAEGSGCCGSMIKKKSGRSGNWLVRAFRRVKARFK